MFKQIHTILRYTNISYHHQSPIHYFSTKKPIKDTDDLTIPQMQQLLGHKINPSSLKQSKSNIPAKHQQSPSSDLSQYFYGLLPKINQNYPICLDPDQYVIQETPNQNIFHQLNLDKNCSFDEYTAALSKYRTQADLYGDTTTKQVIPNDTLQFKELLNPDSQYLYKSRHGVLVNLSIPGTIESEDSRNFLDLRPVEQFRHTPLIPISESYMRKHKEMLERYHRKQMVFEISKESVISWAFMAVCVGIAGYLIWIVMEKEDERTIKFMRMKNLRKSGESQEESVFKI